MHMYEGMLLYFYVDDLLKYDRDEINKAIKNKDNSLSSDDVGSGTMLAGIMAGMGKINKNYVGVAEDAELIVVKMGTIDGHYNNAMLNAGYDYIQMAGKQKIDVEDMAEKIYKIFKKVGML